MNLKLMNNNKRKYKAKKGRGKAVSEINPEWLVKQATRKEIVPYVSDLDFLDFDLNEKLKKNIEAKGYSSPTEIQERSFHHLVSGQNLIGIAATGTGKTGAFLIPVIEQMLKQKATALVVVPTRELAQQVESEFRSLTKQLGLKSVCFIGGTNVNKDIQLSNRRWDLIVGTPGRLNDLSDRKALRLDKTPILVMDEFDRMLDMGFLRDINKVVDNMRGRKQTILFSATKDVSQEKLISKIVANPIRVNVSSGIKSSDNVDQSIIKVESHQNKFELLLDLVQKPSFEKIILFADTKRTVNKLSQQLMKSGISADVIHGNKSQNYRTKAINQFKKGKVKVLVATDVASRGIDIKGVTHVINYQLPQTMDSYIHRIGRTGRAESVGSAYTFVN